MAYHPRRMRSLAAVAMTLVALVSAVAFAAAETRFALVRAADRDGTPVAGLTADDMVVEEDGVTCSVVGVAPASYPVAIVIDTSSYAQADFQELRAAVHRFAGALSGRDVAVYTTGTAAMRLVDFTRDLDRVESAIGRAFAEPNSAPHRFDAIIDAARHLGELGQPVTRIVIVSAGGPDASGREPRDIVAAVMGGRVIVDVVDLQQFRGHVSPKVDRRYRTFSQSPVRTDADSELLRKIATRTLGTYERIVDAAGYETSLRRLRAELQAEVVVEYASTSTAAPRLRLGVRLPNVVVRGVAMAAAR